MAAMLAAGPRTHSLALVNGVRSRSCCPSPDTSPGNLASTSSSKSLTNASAMGLRHGMPGPVHPSISMLFGRCQVSEPVLAAICWGLLAARLDVLQHTVVQLVAEAQDVNELLLRHLPPT